MRALALARYRCARVRASASIRPRARARRMRDARARFHARDAEDGSTLADVDEWLDAYARDDAPPGVFATYGDDGACTCVAHARDLGGGLRAARARVGVGRTARARVLAFRNGAMATEENMRAEAARWRAALGGELAALDGGWEGGGGTRDGTRARGEDGDVGAARTEAGTEGAGGVVVSPFAKEALVMSSVEVGAEVGVDADAPTLELTAENVDRALDEVRPYLVADGGNVELIKIEDGIVVVRLNGACGTCASSAATMKGGIEKLLKQKFGAAIEEVVNVSGELEEMSVEKLEAHLEKLRKSIASYGGEVSVESLERGVCVLRFKGPQALAFSIAQALKNKFPLVRECKIRQVN